MLGRRGGDQGDQERLEDPEVVDRMLEEKYNMPFEDFYYISLKVWKNTGWLKPAMIGMKSMRILGSGLKLPKSLAS